ncbi:hypothetical protein STEG23_035706 [Scotinomys teguina]
MFMAAVFLIARTWKQPKCPSTEEWIKKMWYKYMMEYYSAEKNNNIMKFAGKWMELENIILSEVTQTRKDKHDSIYFFVCFLYPIRLMEKVQARMGNGSVSNSVYCVNPRTIMKEEPEVSYLANEECRHRRIQ